MRGLLNFALGAVLAALLVAGIGVAENMPGGSAGRPDPRFLRRPLMNVNVGPLAIVPPEYGAIGYDGLQASFHVIGGSFGSTTNIPVASILEGHSGTATLGPVMACRRSHGETGPTSTVASGDILCTQTFGGWGGSTASWKGAAAVGAGAEGGAAFEAAATEAWSGTTFGGQLGIYTVKTGASALTQRILMNGSGTTTVSQDVTDVQTFCVTSAATNDDPNYCIYQGRQTVSGNSTINIITIAAPASTSNVILEAQAICSCTSGSQCTAGNNMADVRGGLFRISAGTATEIEEQADYASTFLGGGAASAELGGTFDLSTSGGNILVRYLGIANENATCHATATVSYFNT